MAVVTHELALAGPPSGGSGSPLKLGVVPMARHDHLSLVRAERASTRGPKVVK